MDRTAHIPRTFAFRDSADLRTECLPDRLCDGDAVSVRHTDSVTQPICEHEPFADWNRLRHGHCQRLVDLLAIWYA